MIRAVADSAFRPAIEDAREEQRKALSRYRADVLAAEAPLGPSLLAGALSGILVYCVPLAVLLGSFILLRLFATAVDAPAQLLILLFGPGVFRGGRPVPATPVAAPESHIADAQVPTGIEATLDTGGGAPWVGAAALIAFWPIALLIIGALLAWLYRTRRRRRRDELARTPLEFPVWPEAALFYSLTAGAGLLVGIGTFVALGANLIFAWAGALIWRWLYDAFLLRFAPASARTAADAEVQREMAYQKALREGRL